MGFNRSILLVDDESHIRKFIGLLLKQLGRPTIVEATNGAEAVAIYESRHPRPALVLLDVNMPVMDGMAALKRLREIDPDCVVIMLTSLANRATVEEAIRLGAANYLLKDTPKDALLQALDETITACFPPDEPVAPA
jgi:two-component system chemotaxis response regulator CheY